MGWWQEIYACRRGTATVEEVVLLATVVIGFAAAAAPLGALLLEYHQLIEWTLSLPVP